MHGESSKPVSVLSGVLQGTVLGPLIFLLFINDITIRISPTPHLFVDDCILYKAIKSTEDSATMLQQPEDLEKLF